MALFPGDMSIGWGFGLERHYDFRDEPECDPDGYNPDEPHLVDPLLAVSELEEKVHDSQVVLAEGHVQLEQRITDLEERLRSLTIVVNQLVDHVEYLRTGIEKE